MRKHLTCTPLANQDNVLFIPKSWEEIKYKKNANNQTIGAIRHTKGNKIYHVNGCELMLFRSHKAYPYFENVSTY